ncbi:MAG: hypothetical protein OHK0011_03450 [Turneriella sp.]
MRTKTTLELEAPVYRKLKAMAGKEGKTRFVWPGAVDLAPKIDIDDKKLVQQILDQEEHVFH